MMDFDGRRVLVVGLGNSGRAAASALLERGASVTVTESRSDPQLEEVASRLRARGAEVELGGHALATGAELAILSPGIPPTSEVVKELKRRGIETWSEVELAYRICDRDFLAVTGTNGKTTTTALLAAILRAAGHDSEPAGNIGKPLVEAVTESPQGAPIAVELSSFQLATIDRFRPRVAVVLNIAEDHTRWHGSKQAYAAAKARITENQDASDHFLPNAEDPAVLQIETDATIAPFSAYQVPEGGIGRRGDAIEWNGAEVLRVEDITLPGVAGLEDAIAAAGAALVYGIDPRAVVRGIKGFRPLGHRLEVVAEFDGITFVDDSKATNAHATLAAVRGLKNVVLIAGGDAKGMDLSALAETVPPVTAVVTLGRDADRVREVFEGLVPVEGAKDMEQAVALASRHAEPGGSVLLSPACASLDMYESYAARGEHFAASVRALLEGSRRGAGPVDGNAI
jgi:UDP-N-acetylmuramoylalanine--D-glutamate ligase